MDIRFYQVANAVERYIGRPNDPRRSEELMYDLKSIFSCSNACDVLYYGLTADQVNRMADLTNRITKTGRSSGNGDVVIDASLYADAVSLSTWFLGDHHQDVGEALKIIRDWYSEVDPHIGPIIAAIQRGRELATQPSPHEFEVRECKA